MQIIDSPELVWLSAVVPPVQRSRLYPLTRRIWVRTQISWHTAYVSSHVQDLATLSLTHVSFVTVTVLTVPKPPMVKAEIVMSGIS
jgi:hypothetical protein